MSDGITRREFLKGTGAAIGGAAFFDAQVAKAREAASGAVTAATSASGPRDLLLHVNGVPRRVTVEPRTTLVEVLRDALNLTGTKIGCDRGSCSACTVLIDGEPLLSCMMLAVDVGDRRIVTIEGLARGGRLHPVQEAFVAHDALQCGFCTPGLVLTSAALLEKQPRPSADDVKRAISGHLCRCGTYPHVLAAVLDAAQAMKG